jgi:hypothetical protein
MPAATRPVTVGPQGLEPEPLLGIFIPRAPGLPRGALFLVGVPRSACTPMPAAVLDVQGELISDVRAA